MAVIGRWSGHTFEVSPATIKSFNDLQVKIGSETDAKTENSQQYLTRKNWKPIEVSLSVRMHAGLGYDVRSEANAFVTTAMSDGIADYFYVGKSKLVPCRLMLTEATISNIQINAKGKWTACELSLSLKQAAMTDGSHTGTEGETKISIDPEKTETAKTIAAMLPEKVKEGVSEALATISKMVMGAKKASQAGGGGGRETRVISVK